MFPILFYAFQVVFSTGIEISPNISTKNNSLNHSINSTIPCFNNTDCNYGICNNSTFLCECNKGYLNFFNNGMYNACFYKQKRQYETFVMELILGFGAGQFYSNRIIHGVFKLLAYIIGIASICLFPFTLNKLHTINYDRKLAFGIAFFFCFLAIGFAFLYIYDLIMIKNNEYNDGNGFPLYPWR